MQDEFNSLVPRGKSFLTEKEIKGRKKLTAEEKEKRHQKMLEQTQNDILKKKLYKKLKVLDEKIKQKE